MRNFGQAERVKDLLLTEFNFRSLRSFIHGAEITASDEASCGYKVQLFLQRPPTPAEKQKLPDVCEGVQVSYTIKPASMAAGA